MDINIVALIADNFNKYKKNDSDLIAALNSISKDQIQKQFESYKERESIEKVVKIRYKILEHLTVNSIDEKTLNSIKESVAKEYPNTKILQNWKNFGLCYKLIYYEYEDDVYQFFEKLIIEIIEKLSLRDLVKYRIVDFNGPQNNGYDESWFAIYNKNHDSQKTALQLFFEIKGNEDIRFGLYKHTTSKNNLLTIKSDDLTIDVLIAEFKKHIDVIKNDIPLQDDKNYWLFQANPKIYDLQSFLLNNHANISFSVNQSKKQISKNDIVYFWISGRQGGLFAKGKIYDGPSVLPEFEYEEPYKKDKVQLDNDVFRAYINITNNFVNEPLARDEIKQDYILAQLEVLRFANATNYRITPEQAARIDELLNLENQGDYNMKVQQKSLNTILYGPPGTGKTYHTIEKAIRIVNLAFIFPDSPYSPDDRKIVKDEYARLCREGKIIFTSFHQSLSYEDFIEGIKPVLSDQELQSQDEDAKYNEEKIKYTIEPGIFRNICEAADQKKKIISKYDFDESKIEYNKMSLGNTQKDDENIFEYCINNNVIALGYGGNIDYSNVKNKDDIKKLLKEKDPKINKFSWEAVDRFKNVMKKDEIIMISKGNKYIRAIGRITGEYYYDENTPIRYNHFRKVEWLYTDTLIPVNQILNNKNLSQQTIYQFYKKDINVKYIKSLLSFADEEIEKEKYVLIIDEINRGNVSQIFGELITLIEDDKRAGRPEALEVTLPYSKEKFTVPPNLYIIGTMNTADRSVEALDTALRRRFSFEFMPPRYDLPELDREIAGIKLPLLLETINERITYLLDEDHQIGHSYFMSIEDEDGLCHVFRNKIIPLLKEYFYNDYGRIRLILGDEFVKLIPENVKPKFAVSDVDWPEREQYRIMIDDPGFDIITALKKTIADNS